MEKFLFRNATLATMEPDIGAYGLIANGALAIEGEMIAFAGEASDLPADMAGWSSRDMNGQLMTPGLIDCHTHIVYGGNRAREFEMRLEGASYEDVAKAGGGIVSTVSATRAACEKNLLADALDRLDALMAEGATTVEIKSGYGLNAETELRMLRVARKLSSLRDVEIRTSYLGAHALPPDYKDKAQDYLDEVCLPALEQAAKEGLVDAVDGFCENIAFSTDQIRQVFEKAKSLQLPVKLHAEQLSNQGGAKLAADFVGLSADHLEYLEEDGIKAMAKAGTVAVLLPGAFYTLRETKLPPIELLRQWKVPMAVATDSNPGTSPLTSLLLAMNMACTLFRLTPEEALAGATRIAAKALGYEDRGILKKGMRADLAIWKVSHPAELSYRIGYNSLETRIFGGRL